MSRVLVVVVICAIIFVLVGLSFSPTLLLRFGLNLRSGDLPASKEQPPTLHLTTREWGCKISFTQSSF